MRGDIEMLELMQTNTDIKVARINFSAEGTWLEPWIGWAVEVVKQNARSVTFKYDEGEIYTMPKKIFTMVDKNTF